MLEIEENLQAAFKKLKVDSEGSTASLPVSEGTSPRTFIETTEESKVNVVCASKESWHWCLRKPLRGTIRTQRLRQSQSPVLHPPKFIHCPTEMPSCSQSVHKNPADTSESTSGRDMPNNVSENEQTYPLSDGKKKTDANDSDASMIEIPKDNSENCPGGGIVPTKLLKNTDLSDFQSISEQNKGSDLQNSPQCASERTVHVQPLSSRISPSSLRSCSEQARAHADDVTIEDLSGYMEYFLCIPKKMSHMAEMMYT